MRWRSGSTLVDRRPPSRPLFGGPAPGLSRSGPRPTPVLPTRADALAIVHEFTGSESLRKHMLAVEAAMRDRKSVV